jgi:hypothetical protein
MNYWWLLIGLLVFLITAAGVFIVWTAFIKGMSPGTVLSSIIDAIFGYFSG